LQRIWPLDEENRKAKISQFAKEYGFKLSFYKHGLCAIFEKESSHKPQREYWEIIADNLSRAGWNWGCVTTVDREGRTIFVADAHRDDGRRFVVHAEERLTAFIELERAICIQLLSEQSSMAL
jgi:hypothetical protein